MNIKYWVWSIASAHFFPLISSFLFLTWQLLPRQHTTGILSEYSGCGRAPYALSPSRWVLGNTFPHDCSNTENWTWHLSMWLSLVSDYHSLQRLHYVLCGRWVSVQFSLVQSLSRVWLFATPWIAARQASLSITNSRSLLKLMPIESVMPSRHLIFCRPFLLLPPIPPRIRVFSNEVGI